MKSFCRLSLVFLFIAFISIFSLNAQINLDSGLVAYYPMNGDAQDYSLNANHASLSPNGVYAGVNQNSIPNTALVFNGVFENGMMDCPANLLNNQSAYSISYWFSLRSTTNGMSLVGQDNIIESGFYTSPDRIIVWHPTSGSISINVSPTVDTWNHVVITGNNTEIKIYLNGSLAATQSGNFALSSSANIPRIGGNVVNQSNNSFLRGSVDEVRFYDRILSVDEVNLLSSNNSLTYAIQSISNTAVCTGSTIDVNYTIIGTAIHPDNVFYLQLSDADGSFDKSYVLAEDSSTVSGNFLNVTIPEFVKTSTDYKLRIVGDLPLYQGSPSSQSMQISNPSEGLSTLKDGMILHYAFDANTVDSSGYNRDGSAFGGTSFVDDRFGNPLSAIKLNGTNGYVEVPEDTWFDGNSFAVAVWVNPTNYNSWSRIMDFSIGAGNENVILVLSSGTTGNLFASIRRGTTQVGSLNAGQIPKNEWTHICFTFDGTDIKYYINGNLDASATSSAPRMVKRTTCYIGKYNASSGEYADAAFDDFMMWDRLLTEDEIKVLANDGLIISNSPVCENNQLFLTAPVLANATYQWSGPASFSSNDRNNYIYPATAANDGTYLMTVSLNTCVYNQSQQDISIITAASQVSPSFTGLPATSYVGAANNTLSPTPADGYFCGPGISGNIFNPSAAGVGTHTIVYSYMNAAGCVSTVDSTIVVGQGYPMTNTTITSCSGGFFDSGGSSGNYQNNEDYTITFCSDNGEGLRFYFSSMSIGTGDTLWVYDGPDANSELIAMYIAYSNRDYIWSSGTCLTFRFKSDASATTSGWEASFSCMQDPVNYTEITDMSTGFRTNCSGTFRDPGGSGNYSVGTHRTQTFKSSDGNRLKLDFSMFNLNGNNGGHWLSVYDGPTTNYPLIGHYNEWAWPPGSEVESTGEYLTFVFNATNTSAGSRPGWEATWSCTTPSLPVINILDNDTAICEAVFSDNGGLNANYAENSRDTIHLSALSGKILAMTFNHNNTQFGSGDTLWVFDGDNVNAPLKAYYISSSRLDPIYSSGQDLCFVFHSDASGNGRGWQGYLNCIDAPAPNVTYDMSTGLRVLCSGTFRDPGGSGNYSVGTHRTQTFKSADGSRLRLDFSMFNLNGNNGGHWLSVYDGPTTAYPLIGHYNEWAWPPGSMVESTGEYLTFVFNATNTSAGSRPGWEASISCTTPALNPIFIGDSTTATCDAVFYDHAGPAVNYSGNRRDTTVICSDNNQLLQLIFNKNETGFAAGDTLWIYDGSSPLAPALGIYVSASKIENIVSSTSCLCFVFSSDNTSESRGWQGVVSCITSPPSQINYDMSSGERFVCSGKFRDPGGSGNYPRGSWTQTYTSYNGEKLRFVRNMFNVNGNNGGHPFSVYDGPNTASPLIGTYTNFAFPPAVIQSSGSSLTFRFVSTNTSAGTTAGWDFDMYCFSGNPIDINWLNSPICAGDSFYLDFFLNDTIYAANVFTAQLSDVNGSFSSPTNIGSITASVDSTILVTIPAGITAGTNYRIRVISSAPAQLGNPSPNPITIYAPPTTPFISPASPIQICSGTQEVQLSVSPQSGVNYAWFKDGSIAVGNNQPNYLANTEAAYSVELSNSCGTISSNPVFVEEVSLPNQILIHAPPDTSICLGDTVVLMADSLTNINYQWKLDNVNIGTDTCILTAIDSGVYSLEISNACGSMMAANITEIIIMGQAPTVPIIQTSVSPIVCSGDSLILSVNSPQADNYNWTKDGIALGINNDSIIVYDAGLYEVTVSNTCGSALSLNQINVSLNYPPTIPVITAHSLTDFCQGDSLKLSVNQQTAVDYFWEKDGLSYAANSHEVWVYHSGNYTVSLSNSCGITASQDTITVTVHPLPVVSYAQNPAVVCYNWGLVSLSGESPNGGIFSGNGVTNNEINTLIAGVGSHIITYEYTDGQGCSNSDTSLIQIDNCTDMDNAFNEQLSIYPNPASTSFTIETKEIQEDTELWIYNVYGSLVYYKHYAVFNKESFSTTAFAKASYYIQLKNKELNIIKTMIIE